MTKKNRVIASITIHVTENGTYKVGEVAGELRRHQHDLTWSQTERAIREFHAARAPIGRAAEFSTFSAHSCSGVPIVPPQGPVLDLEAYEKSPPYWIPGSPQRLHLIQLVHAQAQRLQLPTPTLTEIEALLNPFISPTHAALNNNICRVYQIDQALRRHPGFADLGSR